jgi:hypothetical protein
VARLVILVLACVALGSCTSPEATRQRGGGRGADPNNRPAQVKMHEGSRPYWETPVYVPGNGPPLGPSEQARQLSLPSASSSPEPPQKPSSGGGR